MALNRIEIEGTMRRIPTLHEILNGSKRAIFTVRVPRGEDRYDYIDCVAYNEVAESLQHADLTQWVHVDGRIAGFRNTRGEKKHSLVIESWKQIPAPEAI